MAWSLLLFKPNKDCGKTSNLKLPTGLLCYFLMTASIMGPEK